MSISDPSNRHLGTFAEGEREPEAHPEEAHVGTFAEERVRAGDTS